MLFGFDDVSGARFLFHTDFKINECVRFILTNDFTYLKQVTRVKEKTRVTDAK